MEKHYGQLFCASLRCFLLQLPLLQLSFCSSAVTSVKRYTTHPLQPDLTIHNTTSVIHCASICGRGAGIGFAGFNYSDSDCHLYHDATCFFLTDLYSAPAQPVYVLMKESVPVPVYKDCQAAFEDGRATDGVYTLKPDGIGSFDAWCEFDGFHGWTVMQRRMDGSVSFDRDWDDYKAGFGNLCGEQWLGNDKIAALTRTNRLLNIFLNMSGDGKVANYSTFFIGGEEDNYRLSITGYRGDAGDAIFSHVQFDASGQQFTTIDNDNDSMDDGNCATICMGGWWYNSCTKSNLNGVWNGSGLSKLAWYGNGWGFVPIQRVIMRITRD